MHKPPAGLDAEPSARPVAITRRHAPGQKPPLKTQPPRSKGWRGPRPCGLRRLQIARGTRPPISAAFSPLHTQMSRVGVHSIYDHGGNMHVSQLTMLLVRMYPGLTSHSPVLDQSSQLLCVLIHGGGGGEGCELERGIRSDAALRALGWDRDRPEEQLAPLARVDGDAAGRAVVGARAGLG